MTAGMRMVTIVGARPQFVKAAVLSRAIRLREGVTEILVHTGQHYDPALSEQIFADLQLPAPAHHLGVGSGSHAQMTGRMLEGIEAVLLRERPDWVLVYGDTNSTIAGALVAAKLHIRVAHVEAGLRSFNRQMPEEVNRIVTDHLSDLLFAPTEAAIANLAREGLAGRGQLVGDIMFEAARFYAERSAAESDALARLKLTERAYALVTIHRAENTDDRARLVAIANALVSVAETMQVVWPVHPRTRLALQECGVRLAMPGLMLLPPLGYLDMINLERHARVIATDSGGVQKEAYFFGVPCVTLRDETEWVELVKAGANRLVSPAGSSVIRDAILNAGVFPANVPALYGDGTTSSRILSALGV